MNLPSPSDAPAVTQPAWPRILVAGAESRPGLIVIRALGREGIPVVAVGAGRRPLGFASRYAVECRRAPAAVADPDGFVDGVLRAARDTGAALVVPASESALVALEARREEVDEVVPLAAAPSDAVRMSLDKRRMLPFAEELGLPVPRTARGGSREELAEATREFVFPLAVKPFGPGTLLRAQTGKPMDLKVAFADDRPTFERILDRWEAHVTGLIAQEYVAGMGVGIEAIYDRGRHVASLAYDRVREFPYTGGVATIRRSIPLPSEQVEWTNRLAAEMKWHGVVMSEWKRRADGQYVFMELNGRFSAGGAVTLKSGYNFPYCVAALFLGRPLPRFMEYETGKVERWLIGDVMALEHYAVQRLTEGRGETVATRLPPARKVATDFLRDFRPGVSLDEVEGDDLRPIATWLGELLVQVFRSSAEVGKAVLRPWLKPVLDRIRRS